MKNLKKIALFTALALLCSCEETVIVDDTTINITEVDQPVSDCSTAPAEWFAEVGGTRVTPEPNEGPTSVFANNATVTNCDFQRWSWQKFLWLTNETNGRPFFLDNLTQVTSDGGTISKGGDVILTDTGQASNSLTDILKTPGGGGPASTVYYSILVNDTLFDAVKKYAPLAKEDPKSIKGVTFPVGALEMKTSWLDVTALGSDSTTYYITDGQINDTKVRVALLGIHVVGVVENHPEFIWATFEHDDLAAMYDWSGATPDTDNTPITSDDAYPLFAQDASATITNITSGNGIYTDVFSLYKYGVPVEKVTEGDYDVQVFMKTSQNGSENFNNIDELNKSVKGQLTGVWNNYFLNGSLWIDTEGYDGIEAQANLLDSLGGNLHVSADSTDFTRGSVAAYNITMETYVQAGFSPTTIHAMNVTDLVNCFFCHSPDNTDPSPLQISHFFNGYLDGQLNNLTKEQVKSRHTDSFRAKAILKAIKED
jgi:hypothetical protein